MGGAVAGAWRRSTQPPEARGSGGGAPSTRRFFQFFNKNNAFLGLNFCFKHALTIAVKGR